MQKKQLNKVLIVALAIIWGVIIFKYVSPFFKSNEAVAEFTGIPIKSKFKSFKRDTFLLKTIKRDPFLGASFKIKKSGIRKPLKRKIRSNNKNVIWPRIAYLGFVKSNKSKRKLGLVRINNQMHRVRKGTVINGVLVFEIQEDSVGLRFNNDKKYFKR